MHLPGADNQIKKTLTQGREREKERSSHSGERYGGRGRLIGLRGMEGRERERGERRAAVLLLHRHTPAHPRLRIPLRGTSYHFPPPQLDPAINRLTHPLKKLLPDPAARGQMDAAATVDDCSCFLWGLQASQRKKLRCGAAGQRNGEIWEVLGVTCYLCPVARENSRTSPRVHPRRRKS